MRVLVVCYKIAHGEGSESGSGFNFVREISTYVDDLVVVTRNDNARAVRPYLDDVGVKVVGYDPPRILTFWKRGGRGVIPFYYMWQRGVGRLVARLHEENAFDVLHQYNFHTDWAPHFLRAPGTRIIWGPVCHQPSLPWAYIRLERARGAVRELAKSAAKKAFWRFDPNLSRSVAATDVVLYANADIAPPFRTARELRLQTFGGASFVAQSIGAPHEGPLRLLHVGRMVSIKGAPVAVEALAACQSESGRRATLTVIGEGPLAASLLTLAQKLGVAERVTFIKWLPQSELAKHYLDADVLLYPSLANQDTVVAEALAAGLIVVGVETTGTALMAGGAGLMVPRSPHVDTVSGLAETVQALADEKLLDPNAFQARRGVALKRSQAISWSATAAGIYAAYQS